MRCRQAEKVPSLTRQGTVGPGMWGLFRPCHAGLHGERPPDPGNAPHGAGPFSHGGDQGRSGRVRGGKGPQAEGARRGTAADGARHRHPRGPSRPGIAPAAADARDRMRAGFVAAGQAPGIGARRGTRREVLGHRRLGRHAVATAEMTGGRGTPAGADAGKPGSAPSVTGRSAQEPSFGLAPARARTREGGTRRHHAVRALNAGPRRQSRRHGRPPGGDAATRSRLTMRHPRRGRQR